MICCGKTRKIVKTVRKAVEIFQHLVLAQENRPGKQKSAADQLNDFFSA